MKELEGIRLAPFMRRAIAFFIDTILAGIVAVAFYFGYAALTGTIEKDGNVVINAENWESILAMLLYFGVATYLGNGKTLGKKLMKIRVVSLTHARMTFWQSIERALGYGASLLEGGFGFLQCFTHANRRTVHDRIAETIVVDERRRPLRDTLAT